MGSSALALAALAAAVVFLAAGAGARARFTISQTRPRRSRVDGGEYRVHEDHPEPDRAADRLAALNGRVIELLRHLRDKQWAPATNDLAAAERADRHRRAAERLLANYSPDALAENSPRDPSRDTSYVVDKGVLVAVCLRDRDDPAAPLHDLETLTFVTLHEMAHIALAPDPGARDDHPPLFWAAFRWLLKEAEEARIFVSPDYARAPRRYCGVTINYSPRWDATLGEF